MYWLNLDKDTSRILSVAKLGKNISLQGGACLEELPANVTKYSDYCYINNKFIYSPAEQTSAVAEQALTSSAVAVNNTNELDIISLEQRVTSLEESIQKLTEAVNNLLEK